MSHYTDAELAQRQERTESARHREIYRLARLGLAAEQVGEGQDTFRMVAKDSGDSSIRGLREFIDHPAWEAK